MMLAVASSLPWHWLAVAVISAGIGYVAGHEGGYRKGYADCRRRVNEYRRSRERAQ